MKKILSILIALLVLINFIGSGFMSIESYAIAGVDDAAISGIVLSMLGSMFGVPIQTQEMQNSKLNNLNMQALKNGEIVTVYNTGDSYRFKASDTVSEADRELAETLAEKLNAKNVAGTLTAGFINEYGSSVNSPGTSMSANTYSAVKTDIINAYYDSLVSTMSGPIDPSQQKYNFSFTEPIQGYSVPAISNEGLNVIRDGYELSTPFTIRNVEATFASEPKTVCGLTVSACYGDEGAYEPYVEITTGKGCYGFGYYIVHNNEIYYLASTEAGTEYCTHPGVGLGAVMYDSNMTMFYTSDGKCLADNINSKSELVGCFAGLYFYENPNCSGRPENDISPSELVGAGTAGFLINNDISPEERMIKEAIIAGILPEDFPIELNDRGEIVSVNGINMATIQQLLTKLTTDQIKFSDVQSYLEAIKNACEGTDATADQIAGMLASVERNMVTPDVINTAIDGIKELEAANAEKLTNIEAYLATIAGAVAISETAEIPKGFEIDTPDIITDKFPFSLPYDIYHTFNLLSADPVAPSIHFPIKMEGVFDFSIDVDLSEYNWIAEIVRWFLFIVFVIGLILATNKLIGRG